MLNADLRERLGELALALAPPRDRYSGFDPTEAVQVELTGPDSTATVRLAQHWRRTVGRGALGPAVLAAVHAASVARLAAWATRTTEKREQVPANRPDVPTGWNIPRPATRQDIETLTRAWRDLREFTYRLADLHGSRSTVHSQGRQVAVTVHNATLAEIAIEQSWADVARDSEIERILADTINDAFAAIAAIPVRALDGCPDLEQVLSAHRSGPGGMR